MYDDIYWMGLTSLSQEFSDVPIEKIQKTLDSFRKTEGMSGAALLCTLYTLRNPEGKLSCSESGLAWTVMEEGEGDKIKSIPTSTKEFGHLGHHTLECDWTGFTLQGTKEHKFAEVKGHEVQLKRNRCMSGWLEAFLDMRQGEKRSVIMPSHLGFDDEGGKRWGLVAEDPVLFELKLVRVIPPNPKNKVVTQVYFNFKNGGGEYWKPDKREVPLKDFVFRPKWKIPANFKPPEDWGLPPDWKPETRKE